MGFSFVCLFGKGVGGGHMYVCVWLLPGWIVELKKNPLCFGHPLLPTSSFMNKHDFTLSLRSQLMACSGVCFNLSVVVFSSKKRCTH